MEKMLDFALLEKLCLADGVSGFEDEVRELIATDIEPFCDELYRDAVGNLIAVRYGKDRNKRVMLCAHMDEVGFCIKYVNDDGTLLFDQVGMNASVLPSKRVLIGKDKIPGVIGLAPVHVTKGSKDIKTSDLCIDVGAKNAEEAQHLFGQYAVFDSDFCEFGNGLVKAKALDDRIGCAVMCALCKEDEFECDTYFVFTVGEEVGGVGAAAAANAVKPDVCLVLEGTTASDIYGNDGADKVCSLRCGPVCPFMDGGTLYDAKLYESIMKIAKENSIPCQAKTRVAGGTDASKIQKTGSGNRVAALSLPCRYIHTSASVASVTDMQNMYRLAKSVLPKLHQL